MAPCSACSASCRRGGQGEVCRRRPTYCRNPRPGCEQAWPAAGLQPRMLPPIRCTLTRWVEQQASAHQVAQALVLTLQCHHLLVAACGRRLRRLLAPGAQHSCHCSRSERLVAHPCLAQPALGLKHTGSIRGPELCRPLPAATNARMEGGRSQQGCAGNRGPPGSAQHGLVSSGHKGPAGNALEMQMFRNSCVSRLRRRFM